MTSVQTNDVFETSLSAHGSDKSIFNLLYSIGKKAVIAKTIYFVGYMHWSVAWLVTAIVLIETREYLLKSSEFKREITKASAETTEKHAILSRLSDLPSWVNFPDFERCEWVNIILQQLWPNASDFAKKLIINILEPKICKALHKYKLSHFEFDRNHIQFGATPPRIGGIKVYDRNTLRDEIIVDMELIFASDCNIKFRLAGMTGRLEQFEIFGMIRVILKPLISMKPFIGGLQVSFLDKPDIDFQITGTSELLDAPGINDILHRIIAKKIAKALVTLVSPNKYHVTLRKDIPSMSLKMPEPEGVLRIQVVEARDLIKQDIGFLGSGKSDPYVLVTIGAQRFRTRTIYKNLDPVWNFWCEACIEVKCPTPIRFRLFDWDRTGGHDPLGSATIDLRNVLKNGYLDTWIALEGVKHGELHVRLIWNDLSSSAQDLTAALAEAKLLSSKISSAVLSVYLDSADNISQNYPDAFAILTVGNQKHLTSVKKATNAPIWERGFTFLVGNPEQDTLTINIRAKSSSHKDGEMLGQFTYRIGHILSHSDLRIPLQSFQLTKSEPTATITMSLALQILKTTDHSLEDIHVFDNLDDLSEADTKSISSKSSRSSSDSQNIASGQDKVTNKLDTEIETGIEVVQDTQSPCDTFGLGQIQITLEYNINQQQLSVTIHKVINIPSKDPLNMPNPYVKLYLLPGRSKKTKRKTKTVHDSCDPIFETTFNYDISIIELKGTQLELVVSTKKTYGRNSVLGMLRLPLEEADILSSGTNDVYELLPKM